MQWRQRPSQLTLAPIRDGTVTLTLAPIRDGEDDELGGHRLDQSGGSWDEGPSGVG